MGFLDKLTKIIDFANDVKNELEQNKAETVVESEPVVQIKQQLADIELASSTNIIEDIAFGGNDQKYRLTYKVNAIFKEAKSHAGEVMMLATYAPNEDYGAEGDVPYVAFQCDDVPYTAVEEYKEKGTFSGAIELTPLTGRYYFKAKKKYYEYMMYFYGLDCYEGSWENMGLCMVYPMEYVGTENEKKLMTVLDEVAESYTEEKV